MDDEIFEDFYESLGYEKQQLLSQIKLQQDNSKLQNIKSEGNNKMNKLKLLLYQKFLNILFSIIGLNIRRGLKEFYENCKFLKIKTMGFKLDSNNKV
jgi:hypothetical protein